MIDYDNSDSSTFSFLIPGIRKWAEQRGCEFYWNGFVPAIKYQNKTEDLDMRRICFLATSDKYSKLNIQINNAIEKVLV